MSGIITAASAVWTLVIAFAVHVLISGRLAGMVPARLGSAVLPRWVTSWTLAGVAGLVAVSIGAWLHRATTASTGWTLAHLHLSVAAQTVVGALAFLVTLSVITAIIAGHTVSGRFVGEAVLATALLSAIPGPVGDFLRGVLRAIGSAVAFLLGWIV